MALDSSSSQITAALSMQLDRVSLATNYIGRPLAPPAPRPLSNSSSELQEGGSFGLHQELVRGPSVADVATQPGRLSEAEKPMVYDLAAAAVDELVRLAQEGEPLWVDGPDDKKTLNYDEYVRSFPGRGIGPKPFGLKTEATRASGLVMMNSVSLVETLMDHRRWADMFSCLVSRALTVEVLSTGVVGNRNNALQMMYAETHVLSPLVPTREMYFLRHCKKHGEGVWAVVDVSVDSLRDDAPPALILYRRRPSGCLIQDMPNGYSKVTIMEQVEGDDRAVNKLYKFLVNSGQAFGAQRWLGTLQRQCELLASMLASSLSTRDLGGVPNAQGRRSTLKLAQRMTKYFCAGVSASSVHTWSSLSGNGDDDVRVRTRNSVDNPGEPHGIVISAATSLWLPVTPQRIFEFLRDERLRYEWDILSNGGVVAKMAHVAKGQDSGNSVSILRVMTGPESPRRTGSLLTVAFQILVSSVPSAESVTTVRNLISCTVQRIKNALHCDHESLGQ